MLFSHTFLIGFHGMRTKSSHPNITTIDLIHISYTSIHNDTCPSIVLCLHHRITSQYCTAQTGTPIHNKHSSIAFLFKKLPNQDIVFKHLQGNYRSGKDLSSTINLKNWLKGTELPAQN
uniref:Uncharacterized protein n=1 Tax=Medicago truncatula TaxID=3880 RepID=I3SP69_MEDTR|nr:unknown [Medicago truncatula]